MISGANFASGRAIGDPNVRDRILFLDFRDHDAAHVLFRASQHLTGFRMLELATLADDDQFHAGLKAVTLAHAQGHLRPPRLDDLAFHLREQALEPLDEGAKGHGRLCAGVPEDGDQQQREDHRACLAQSHPTAPSRMWSALPDEDPRSRMAE